MKGFTSSHIMMSQDFTSEQSRRGPARYLGIHVRSRSFGFVVIEEGTTLDCGVRMCDRFQLDDCLGARFSHILRLYSPADVIVGVSGRRTGEKDSIFRAIKRDARKHNIPVSSVSSAALRKYFHGQNAHTRYEIALAVARIFPELSWQLPAKRKPWQSEHHRLSIFNAAASVIAHTARYDS